MVEATIGAITNFIIIISVVAILPMTLAKKNKKLPETTAILAIVFLIIALFSVLGFFGQATQ